MDVALFFVVNSKSDIRIERTLCNLHDLVMYSDM